MTSSITDGQTLGDAVQWTATPTGGVELVSVDFLVDDQVKWTERTAPFVFDDDRGVLPPWLLGPGSHRLGVRATTTDGRQATATSTVTVGPTPTGDAALVGDYERTVSDADVTRVAPYRTKDNGAFGDVPETGQWTLTVSADGLIKLTDPHGGTYFEPYTAQQNALTLYGPAVWLQTNPSDPFLFCEPEARSGYTAMVAASTLTVAAVDQKCADRDQVFVGTWNRHT